VRSNLSRCSQPAKLCKVASLRLPERNSSAKISMQTRSGSTSPSAGDTRSRFRLAKREHKAVSDGTSILCGSPSGTVLQCCCWWQWWIWWQWWRWWWWCQLCCGCAGAAESQPVALQLFFFLSLFGFSPLLPLRRDVVVGEQALWHFGGQERRLSQRRCWRRPVS
jgi:hypothetical protein